MKNQAQYNQPLISARNVPKNLDAAPQLPNQAQVYAQHTPYNAPSVVPPQNYVPIPNQPMPSYQYVPPDQQVQIIQQVQPLPPIQPPDIISNSLEMAELMQDLSEVLEVDVLKYFQGGGSLFSIGERQKYMVRIRYKDDSTRNIFICQRSPGVFNNGTYIFEIRMKYLPINSNNSILQTKDFNKRLIDISSNDVSGFKPRIYVKNVENNTIIGTIQQPRCCTCCCRDPNIEIYSRYTQNRNLPKYFVTTDGFQCAYCCCNDCCCAEGDISFQIFDILTHLLVGSINKPAFNTTGNEDYLTYNIQFPLDALPEEKLLIIATAIGIDNVEYKQVGKHLK